MWVYCCGLLKKIDAADIYQSIGCDVCGTDPEHISIAKPDWEIEDDIDAKFYWHLSNKWLCEPTAIDCSHSHKIVQSKLPAEYVKIALHFLDVRAEAVKLRKVYAQIKDDIHKGKSKQSSHGLVLAFTATDSFLMKYVRYFKAEFDKAAIKYFLSIHAIHIFECACGQGRIYQ